MTSMIREGFGLVQTLRPEGMTDFVTPTAGLFSVWHLGIPDVQDRAWTLTVGGLVGRPLALDLADLRRLPQANVISVHECAGSPLKPEVPQRRVGNVRWGGVRLRDLLEAAGIEPGAAYVVSVGCDHGTFDSVYHDRYEKDLPISKALDGSTLVALWELAPTLLPCRPGRRPGAYRPARRDLGMGLGRGTGRLRRGDNRRGPDLGQRSGS